MARVRRTKPSPLTEQEMAEAVELGQEVIGITTDNDARCLFLKLVCRNGNTATLWFDAHVVDDLLRHLEKVFLGEDRDPGSGSRLKLVRRVVEAYGNAPQPSDQTPQPRHYSRPVRPLK
jgi:hypothetical protein